MVKSSFGLFMNFQGCVVCCLGVREGFCVRIECAENVNHLEVVNKVFPQSSFSMFDSEVIVCAGCMSGV